jgi:hypothetical protein
MIFLEKVCQIFIGLSLSILLNDFFERRCPDEYRKFIEKLHNLLISLSYNCIYYYSKLQILLFKSKDDLNRLVDNNPTLSNLRDEINKLLSKNTSDKPKLTHYFVRDSYIYNNENSEKYFVICDDAKQVPISKRIIYDESYSDAGTIDFVKSVAKFLLIEFKIDDEVFKIDLSTNEFDYYFVGNKFTKEFFIYYVKTYLKSDLSVTPDSNCSIKFIDNDVNTRGFEFTNNQSINLLHDNYSIGIKFTQ